MVKDFDYFVDRDHQITNKIYKTQQKADILWMEQLTSAQGERQVNSFQIKTINQKSATYQTRPTQTTRFFCSSANPVLAFLMYVITLFSPTQGLLYRWTEHSILPISTGGGF